MTAGKRETVTNVPKHVNSTNGGKICRWRKGPGKRGHIVADTNVSPFARERNICCGHKFCVRDKCFPVCAAQDTSWATMCGPQQRILVYQNLEGQESGAGKNATSAKGGKTCSRRTDTKSRKLCNPPPDRGKHEPFASVTQDTPRLIFVLQLIGREHNFFALFG